jgi:hypothetical protein
MSTNLAQAGFAGFNSAEVEPDSYENLPAGSYTGVITDSVLKETKNSIATGANNAKYIEVTLEVIDGQYKGRKIWDRLNVINPNPQTVQIAAKTLSAIARAVGIYGVVEDTAALHDKPLNFKVTYKGDDARLSYNSLSGVPSPAAGGGSAPAPAAAKKPWEK